MALMQASEFSSRSVSTPGSYGYLYSYLQIHQFCANGIKLNLGFQEFFSIFQEIEWLPIG